VNYKVTHLLRSEVISGELNAAISIDVKRELDTLHTL